MEPLILFERLGIALAVGLLIGTERGWELRQRDEGHRVGGLRTYGLTGLLGGVWTLLARELGGVALGLGFAALATVWLLAHLQVVRQRSEPDLGVTSVVAALLTFALGGLAVAGHMAVAAAGGVITALLLGLKPQLHAGLKQLTENELMAVMKLALISVVILPVLPNEGYGPWGALNPYALWWMVVLIAAISSVGYFATKVIGSRRGVPLTGLFGGLASSTATTLSFARMGRSAPRLSGLLAAGITVSAATMFPRMLVEATVVNRDLVPALLPAAGAMGLIGFAGGWLLWARTSTQEADGETHLQNPFELVPALQFGALLAIVMVLAEGAEAWLGDAGIYLLAAASGLTDVDAITLSLARMADGELADAVAVRGMIIAAMVNTVVKAGLATAIGGRALAVPVLIAFGAMLAGGGLVLLGLLGFG